MEELEYFVIGLLVLALLYVFYQSYSLRDGFFPGYGWRRHHYPPPYPRHRRRRYHSWWSPLWFNGGGYYSYPPYPYYN